MLRSKFVESKDISLKRIARICSVLCALCSVLCALCSAQGQFVYDSKGKRNPFIPLVTSDGRLMKLEQQEVSGLHVEGVIFDKSGISYAVVNSEVIKVGDTVSGYQVLKVLSDKVIFIKDGITSEVELKKEGE